MASQQARKKNWAVYILFALVAIAGILAFIDTGRYMGWIPISATVPGLGEISFVYPDAQWFAALMAAFLGAIWFLVAYWLWTLNLSGWMFVVIISIFNLIFLGLAVLGRTTFSQVLPAGLVNALALILALLPGTKAAFIPRMPFKEAVKDTRAKAAVAPAMAAPKAAALPATPEVEAAKSAPPVVEDLTVVKGTGPKTAEALQAAGVSSLADLAAKTPRELHQILKDAGLSADPTTWPAQAQLAVAGKMNELKAYQEKLKGGREVQK